MFCIFSCDENKQKPVSFIARDKMAAILSDLHIAEAGINNSTSNKDSIAAKMKSYQQFIFEKFAVNETQFNENFEYYLKNTSELDSVYSDVLSNINKIQLKK